MTKYRLTASEREALLRLNAAVDILLTEPEHLARRVNQLKHGRRDVAMLAAVTRKLIRGISETIPDEQLVSYLRNLGTASYLVGNKRPGALTRDEWTYGTWVEWGTINALLAGCHDKCTLCDLDAQARRSCPLRRALDSIPNEMADRESGDCPYYAVI